MSDEVRDFMRSAPGKRNPKVNVPIVVAEMTARDALWWDTRMGPIHIRDATRADRFWAWAALLPACHLTQMAQRRLCRPLVIWARADNGRYVRVGMSIIIERYPYLNATDDVESHFVWFIAAADAAVLEQRYQMSNPPSLMRVHLDNATVLSFNAGLEGRIGLHAAAAGGQLLLDMYAKCLRRLPDTAPMPSGIRRRNDGRFFYGDVDIANSLMLKHDPHR